MTETAGRPAGSIVYIRQVDAPDDPRLINHVQNAYAMTALNEIMHHAASGGSSYSNRDLARALFNVLSPAEQANNPLPKSIEDTVNGRYFPRFFDQPLSSFRREISMKTYHMTVFLCGLVLMIVPTACAQEWKKSAPLKSTRADVERLLGPNDKSSYGVTYDLKDGILSIEYSSGPCRKERKGGWNVPEGVVVSLSFSPKKKQRERDLKLNRKKFRRVVDSHTGHHIYYINDRDGIMYQTQQGLVDTIEYFPPKRYDHLHCGDHANENNTRVRENTGIAGRMNQKS